MKSAHGSVVRLGEGRWRVFVTVPATGRRRSKVVRGTQRDAELMRARMLLEAGSDADGDMTFREFVENVWMPAKDAELKDGTMYAYRRQLERGVYEKLGDLKMKSVAPAHIRAALAMRTAKGQQRYLYVVLHGIFQMALYDGLIDSNPVAKVRKPKAQRSEPDVLDADQARAYLEAARGTDVEAAVLLGIGCGLRLGEALALDGEDIGSQIHIGKNYTYSGGHAHMGTPKTDTSVRTVTVPASILARLREVVPETGPIAASGGRRMSAPVFYNHYQRMLGNLPEGVPRVTFRNLRHTSLTLAFDGGADLLDVSLRAGHSSVDVTSGFYVRPKGSRDAQTAAIIDEALRVRKCAEETETLRFQVVTGSGRTF